MNKTYQLQRYSLKTFKSIIIESNERKVDSLMKILDVPTTSISEVKRSPMETFQKATHEASGVYVFN